MLGQDEDLAKAKWLLWGFFLFLITGCLSYGELRYWMSGRDAEAVVSKSFETYGKRGRPTNTATVEYDFVEPDGTRRGGSDDVPLQKAPDVGDRVKVRYMPGADGKSRLAGNTRWLAVGGFLAACAVMAGGIIMLLREGAQSDRPRKRAKKRRR